MHEAPRPKPSQHRNSSGMLCDWVRPPSKRFSLRRRLPSLANQQRLNMASSQRR
jgi:hypothetical protein